MSLTIGSGPFGHRPAGSFNFQPAERVLYVEQSPRHVRAVRGGEIVAQSNKVKLLHESGRLPVFYFPEEDVQLDLLEEETFERHEGLPGHVAPVWGAMDAWYEEEEQIFGHPRDPYHRIDLLESARHVRISVNGNVVAESRRPLVLFETALPPRYYLDPVDVRTDLLVPHEKRTRCAYKGVATHWSVRTDGGLEEALVWSYPDPNPEVERIAGRLAFYNERVDLEVDGELDERPRTQWSPDGWERRFD
jgi:uncharacterized protein (DUF427 family)